jgi:hypothetical protein
MEKIKEHFKCFFLKKKNDEGDREERDCDISVMLTPLYTV